MRMAKLRSSARTLRVVRNVIFIFVLVVFPFARLFGTRRKIDPAASARSPEAEEIELQTGLTSNIGDLCEALLQASHNHTLTLEILARAQYPSAQVDLGNEPSTKEGESLKKMDCGVVKALDNPKQIIDVFLFGGGEVDTLEIRLLELLPVVDKFIAVTSNVTCHK